MDDLFTQRFAGKSAAGFNNSSSLFQVCNQTHTHIELSCKGRLAWLQLAEEHFNLMKHFTPSLSASVSALQAKRKTLKMEECVQTRVRRVWVFYYYTFISLRFLSNSVGINKFLVFSCFIQLNIASVQFRFDQFFIFRKVRVLFCDYVNIDWVMKTQQKENVFNFCPTADRLWSSIQRFSVAILQTNVREAK